MPEFFETRMGQKFYDGTMPKIAHALESVAASLELLAERQAAPLPVVVTADESVEQGWAAITIEFIGGSDDKTAGNLLSHLNTYTLRLTIATDTGRQYREIRMVDAAAVSDDVGGIAFEPVDNDGAVIGPMEFLDYARILALGIY